MADLHVIGLPHTQTTAAFNLCAYTAKVRKFCGMMTAQGYRVVLYAGDENEARCDELVTCITRERQAELFGDFNWYRAGEIYNVGWDPNLPYWREFTHAAIAALLARVQPRDIICLPVGTPLQPIIEAFPNHLVVETGVGYAGITAPHQVYESYAWMHTVYGQRHGAMTADGRFYDAVIPNFFETTDFPADEPDDYFLFMSRMTHRKGYEIAIEATRRVGAPLKIAGIGGDRPEADHVEYVGLADTAMRGELLSHARAVFMPTLYLEPFGGVAVESLLCGTPVICTDWGAFPELVEQGIHGFRCRTMSEFAQACHDVDHLDREAIREHAQVRFSTETVGGQYDQYFTRLASLWGDGFYAEPQQLTA